MTEDIVAQLIQGGSMGLFAAFLVWQHLGMQKRLDGLVTSFQSQITAINKDYDERIEKMRERYDIVINSLRAEKDERDKAAQDGLRFHQGEIVTRLTEIQTRSEVTSTKIDGALSELRAYCDRNG